MPRKIIASGAGPVDGHPHLLSSFRAELSGILAAVYIISKISAYYKITIGKFHLFCDNKGALKMAFKPMEVGITPYLNSDHDLVELIRSLIDLLPITVTYEWVKGHYTGKNKESQHYLNDDTDDQV
jgi:hypothetical protein